MLARRLAALTLFFLDRPAPLARKLFLHQHRHGRARARSLVVTTTRREHGGPRSRSNSDSPAEGPSRKAPLLKRTSSRDEQRGPSVEDASTSAGASRPTEAQGCECDPGQTQSPQTFAQRREAEAEGETHQTLGTCECCEEKASEPEDSGAKNSENKHHRQHEADAKTAAQKDDAKADTDEEKEPNHRCELTQDMEQKGMTRPVPLHGKLAIEVGDPGFLDHLGSDNEVMCVGSDGHGNFGATHFNVGDSIGKIQQLTVLRTTHIHTPELLEHGVLNHTRSYDFANEWPWVDRWIHPHGWQRVLPPRDDKADDQFSMRSVQGKTSENFDAMVKAREDETSGDVLAKTVVGSLASKQLHFRPLKPLPPGRYRLNPGGHHKDVSCFRLLVCGDAPEER